MIDVPGVPNLRDVGGWPTPNGGRVRRGQLYRSIQVNRLHGTGLAAFEALDIRTVYDLRTALDEMTARFGDVEGYFGAGLGIDAGTRAAFTDVTVG